MQVIGFCGISGSGKSYLINELSGKINKPVTIISMDNYYKPLELQQMDENGVVNFDLPEAIYYNKIAEHIELLRKGNTVNWQTYGFNFSRMTQIRGASINITHANPPRIPSSARISNGTLWTGV